jgi:hypothetical protein
MPKTRKGSFVTGFGSRPPIESSLGKQNFHTRLLADTPVDLQMLESAVSGGSKPVHFGKAKSHNKMDALLDYTTTALADLMATGFV